MVSHNDNDTSDTELALQYNLHKNKNKIILIRIIHVFYKKTVFLSEPQFF